MNQAAPIEHGGYSIFLSDLEKNREEILHSWKKNLPHLPEARYPWIYEKNPYGPAACWLAKYAAQDKVVGATALFPRKFLSRGKPLMAGIAGDFGVDQEHRGFGPALSLQRAAVSACKETGFEVLYGIPTGQSEPALLRAGYKIVGHMIRMTKLIRSDDYLKRRIGWGNLPKAFLGPVNLAIRLLSKESYRTLRQECLLRPISVFDERFDRFWERVSGRYSLIGERKSRYLNWRFIQCPHKNYSVFALTRKETDEILGYVCAYVAGNRIHVADL
ncbi:MAG TPA: GNAT family N-acetyltransferase, partial [Candidatus Manganitrophaceae bacterium]|nr:GNAT family N-acetyltransferase [Candidatus Manganitrophaceae bacterium]